MRKVWKQFSVCMLGLVVTSLSGCATMQNIGNSLAFWKKSPPTDQFATNMNKPSTAFSPSGTSGPGSANSLASKPSSMPFGNTGRPGSSFGQNPTGNSAAGGLNNAGGFGSSPSFASNPTSGSMAGNPKMRSPYSSQMPGSNKNASGFGSSNQFSNQPAAHTANNSSFSRPSTAGGTFSPKSSSFGASSPSPSGGFGTPKSSFNPSASGNSGFATSPSRGTPSSQFRNSSSGFSPSGQYTPTPKPTGSFSPGARTPGTTNPSMAPTNPSMGNPSMGNPSMAPTSPAPNRPTSNDNWKNYPSTNYPGFGSSSAKQPSSGTGFESKNVPASANMSPPPSLPSTVFEKQGGYSPGSTGTSGKASRAGFESNTGLYSPPTGSKIPSTTGLYSPSFN